MKLYILLIYIINLALVLCLESDCVLLSSYFKKYNYDIKNDCCNEPGIECEDNYIKSIDLTLKPGKIDFSYFPYFEKLEKLSIKGDVFEGQFPVFSNLCNAQYLDFSHSSIKYVSDNALLNFPEVKELNLSNNLFETFPYEISPYFPESLILDNNKMSGSLYSEEEEFYFETLKKLSLKNNNFAGDFIVPSNIQYLNIENNKISSMKSMGFSDLKELNAGNNNFDNDIFKYLEDFEKLEKLTLSENKNIDTVSESIGKLSKLKYLDLSKNNLKELHSNLFILTKLEDFNISENPNLNTKIIKFSGSNIVDNCNFNNTKISCYQPGTCANINNDYDICSDEEIQNIKSTQTLRSNGFSYLIKIGVIVILIILIIILCCIIVCCCCLKKCTDCCCNCAKHGKKNKKIVHSSPMYSDNLEMHNNNNINNHDNNNNNNSNDISIIRDPVYNLNNNYNNDNNVNNLSQIPNTALSYSSIYMNNNTPTAPVIEVVPVVPSAPVGVVPSDSSNVVPNAPIGVVPNVPYGEGLEPSSSSANCSYSYNYSYNYNNSFNNDKNNNNNRDNNNNNNNNNKNSNKNNNKNNDNNNINNNDALPTYEEAISHLNN